MHSNYRKHWEKQLPVQVHEQLFELKPLLVHLHELVFIGLFRGVELREMPCHSHLNDGGLFQTEI